MQIQQNSEQVGETKWKWSIWLDGTPAELDAVKEVVYHLHPTFANPVVSRSDRGTNFRLDASGWGTFVVKIEIHKADGDIEWMRHRLKFSHDAPRIFVAAGAEQNSIVDEVRAAMQGLQIGVVSAEDLAADVDYSAAIKEQIDRAKAVVLVNGPRPSRWVQQEVGMAQSLGKKIVSIGRNDFYNLKGAEFIEVGSIGELGEVLGKLEE